MKKALFLLTLSSFLLASCNASFPFSSDYALVSTNSNSNSATGFNTAESSQEVSSQESYAEVIDSSESSVDATQKAFYKISSLDELTSGQYLIVCEEESEAFDGSLNLRNARTDSFSLSISDSVIEASAALLSSTLTFDANAGSFLTSSGYYIGHYSLKDGLSFSESQALPNSVSFSSGQAIIVSNGSTLVYSSQENTPGFFYSSSPNNYSGVCLYKYGVYEKIYPTSISLDSTLSLKKGRTSALEVTFSPESSNVRKISWSSSNSEVASVDSEGKVKANSVGTATISATATGENGTLVASCFVTVEPVEEDDYTVLMYIAGNNLESEDSEATNDLSEILSVDLPEGVNYVIQTGGTTSWNKKYGISSAYSSRYHVENQQLVLDEQNPKVNMGLSSTLQDFLTYGLTYYPAKKTALILWDHGGAMDGVCADAQYDDDLLTAAEVSSALSGAFAEASRTSKLEWIGYDACLMQVQDIASVNSSYFHYMIASQESELGYGWDYDSWLDDLAADPEISTPTLGQEICDGFYARNGDASQTMSVVDLNAMEDYISAWNTLGNNLASHIDTYSEWKSFVSAMNSGAERFGYEQDYVSFTCDGYAFEVSDAYGMLQTMAKNSSYNVTGVAEAMEAFSSVVVYNKHGSGHSNAHGLSAYLPQSVYASQTCYTDNDTKLTGWRNFVLQAFSYLR